MQQPSKNGDKNLLTLTINFDPATQQVGLVFDTAQFKTWDFMLAILEQAKVHAQDRKRDAYVAGMQQMAQQAMVDQQLQAAMQQGKGKLLHG